MTMCNQRGNCNYYDNHVYIVLVSICYTDIMLAEVLRSLIADEELFCNKNNIQHFIQQTNIKKQIRWAVTYQSFSEAMLVDVVKVAVYAEVLALSYGVALCCCIYDCNQEPISTSYYH